jgi:Tfp pilus assembly protein PilO
VSNSPHTENDAASASGRRVQLRVRVEKMRATRQQSFLGVAEILALACSGIMLLAVAFAYFYLLVPDRARLEEAQRKRTQLQAKLRDSQEGFKRNTDTQATVTEISDSLQNFEGNHLVPRSQGRTMLIDQLNSLIRRDNVRISTGLAFTSLDALAPDNPTARSSASTKPGVKGQTSFPGVGVSVTVEGQYENLRRLIRDIEANNQFIVINAIELQGVNDPVATRAAVAMPGATAPPSATTARSTLVSLRLDMAAYFRRDQFAGERDTASDGTTATAPASIVTP